MVSTLPEQQSGVVNAWVKADWSNFLAQVEQMDAEQARCYFDDSFVRIETIPIGSGHAQDNTIIAQVITIEPSRNITLAGLKLVSDLSSSCDK